MGTINKIALASAVASLLGGCASSTGRITTIPMQNGATATATSAETRLVFSATNQRSTPEHPTPSAVITCAEPSPDIAKIASEAFSASANASGQLFGNRQTDASVALGHARAEQAAELGQRLATVQLVRDTLYRACEAYANGAIDETMYAIITSRFDDLMVALFAEQMAQGGQSPEAILLSNANGSATAISSRQGAPATPAGTTPAASEGGDATPPATAPATAGTPASRAALAANASAEGDAALSRVTVIDSGGAGARAVDNIAQTYLNNVNGDALMVACIAEMARPENRGAAMYTTAQDVDAHSRWANNLLGACLHPTDGILIRMGQLYAQTYTQRLEIERIRAQTELVRAQAEGAQSNSASSSH